MVYSGPFSKCQEYFDQIGHPCPPGFNIADYLIDLTKHASRIESEPPSAPPEPAIADPEASAPVENVPIRPTRGRKNSIRELQEHQLYDPRPRTAEAESNAALRDEFGTTQQWASIAESPNPRLTSLEPTPEAPTPPENGSGRQTPRRRRMKQPGDGSVERRHAAEHLLALIHSYRNSAICDEIREEIYDAVNGSADEEAVPEELPKDKRIGWIGQFSILSRRTFKNLYRNPMLMLAHYAIAILMAGTSPISFRK